MTKFQGESATPKPRANKVAPAVIRNSLFSNQLTAPGVITFATKSDASGTVLQIRNSIGTTWRRRGELQKNGMHFWVSLDCKCANFTAIVEKSGKGILKIISTDSTYIIENTGSWTRHYKNGLIEIWDQDSLTLTNRLAGNKEMTTKYLINPFNGRLFCKEYKLQSETSVTSSVNSESSEDNSESGAERKYRIEEELNIRGIMKRKRTRRSGDDSLVSIFDLSNVDLLLSNQRRIAKQYADG